MRSKFLLICALLFLFFCLTVLVFQRQRIKRLSQAKDHADLKNEFRYFTFKSGFFLTSTFVVLSYFLTDIIYNSWMDYFTNYLPEYAVFAGKKFFYVPLAICLSGILIHPIAYLADKIVLSDRYNDYLKYTKQLYGFNIRHLGLGFASFNLIFFLFFTSFLGGHLALDNEKIYFRNTLSFESKIYKFKDLKNMKYSPSKKYSRNSKFRIPIKTLTLEFKDGETYTSEGALYDSWELHAITKNIEVRTGIRPVVEFE